MSLEDALDHLPQPLRPGKRSHAADVGDRLAVDAKARNRHPASAAIIGAFETSRHNRVIWQSDAHRRAVRVDRRTVGVIVDGRGPDLIGRDSLVDNAASVQDRGDGVRMAGNRARAEGEQQRSRKHTRDRRCSDQDETRSGESHGA